MMFGSSSSRLTDKTRFVNATLLQRTNSRCGTGARDPTSEWHPSRIAKVSGRPPRYLSRNLTQSNFFMAGQSWRRS
jgi:hypothetical protein